MSYPKNISFSFDKEKFSSGKIVYFVDISGSTGRVREYHDLSRQIYNQIKDLPHSIVGWDSGYRILSDPEYIQISNLMMGYGGTLTSAMAGYLKTQSSQKIHLVILTDGEVDINDISLCDKQMQDVISMNEICSVSAFISSRNGANCSVLAPFLRGNWTSNVFHDNRTTTSLTSIYFIDRKERMELLDLVKTATDEDQINAIYDRLVSLLTAMTMGKRDGDPNLRSMILEMFKRIKENVKKNLSKNSILSDIETEFFTTKNISVESAHNLMHWYNTAFNGDEFQSKIDFLLRLCDGKLSHLFNPADVRSAALNRATVTTKAQSDVQLAQITPSDAVTPIQCPIMLDDSANMVILLKQDTPIFDELTKSMQDAIMMNTFCACSGSVTELIKKRLDHIMSLEAYLALPDKTRSPMTRDKISGCLVLGADDVSVKATNHAIGKMILGKSGIIGNPDVWFYVLYHYIESGNAPWLTPILPMMRNQLLYRMKNSGCTISMSGLANHVQLKTKFGVALRFVLSQVEMKISKDISSFPNFSGSSQHIINLLDMFECKLPESIRKYCTVVHQLGRLINECKQLHIDAFKTKYRALIGNFYHINSDNLSQCVRTDCEENGWFTEYVPLDGMQTELPDYAIGMSQDMCNLVYNLVQLIDNESTTTFTIIDSKIDYDNIDTLYSQPSPLVNDWKLYEHPFKYDAHNVVIHPITMRPVTFSNHNHWKDEFETYFRKNYTGVIFDSSDARRPSGEVFSGCSMYASFVETYKIHPTLDDFVLYCYKRCKNSQYHHTTIPFVEFCQRVINFYDFARTLPVSSFLARYNFSRNRDQRFMIEFGKIFSPI
jgi:hypothetical protein